MRTGSHGPGRRSPCRGAFSGKELLASHRRDWTDLAFAAWLRHRKRDCSNPKGHDFCKLVAKGICAQCDHDRLAEDDPRRTKLKKKLDELGELMEDEFDYMSATC